MSFTKRALEEQKFLRKQYPSLLKYYDDYMGNICIPDSVWQNDETIRRAVFSIIAEEVKYDSKLSRYVLYRSVMPDEKGNPIPCFVVCLADEV